MGEVGTKKLFEDERIVVWEFALEPGERTPCHTHDKDYMWYVIEGSMLEVFGADGRPLGSFEARTGEVFSIDCRGNELVSNDGRGLRVPATHSARNAGGTRYREILVEKK